LAYSFVDCVRGLALFDQLATPCLRRSASREPATAALERTDLYGPGGGAMRHDAS